jgi:hypothetical protein
VSSDDDPIRDMDVVQMPDGRKGLYAGNGQVLMQTFGLVDCPAADLKRIHGPPAGEVHWRTGEERILNVHVHVPDYPDPEPGMAWCEFCEKLRPEGELVFCIVSCSRMFCADGCIQAHECIDHLPVTDPDTIPMYQDGEEGDR